MSYITIDSSTSSTTVIVFNEKLEIVKRFQKEHRQIITDEGHIEHDLEEIYQNLLELIKKASETEKISKEIERGGWSIFLIVMGNGR